MDLDPERLAVVEQRLSAIHDLARKHRVRADELAERHRALATEVAALEDADGALARLEQARQQALGHYRAAATMLGDSRRAAAGRLAEAVTARVRELGMANAQFVIAVEPLVRERVSTLGDDLVRFDFSANPGQPPRPLVKVASGGELSRVALAIQVSLRSESGAPTMIFDEVDAGIGGTTADVVGRQLAELGAHRQVLCVTHLAQVGARAAHHYGIAKEVSGGQTCTRVRALDRSDRIAEVARMLGDPEAATTKALAKDLLKRAS
jgi:DNA repair protein RecN (Recombination protein N)